MAREVEELKASDLEWLEARRINADHHWPKTDDVLDWVAGENAKLDRILALARRSLPSPEAGDTFPPQPERCVCGGRQFATMDELKVGGIWDRGLLCRCVDCKRIYQATAPEAGGVIAEARARRRSCSCMDVYGEDPNCFKHGNGTEWSKANPDICKLVGDLTEARSDLSRLRDTAETLVAELVTLCRAWMYAPFPAEAQVCGAMSPPSGPLAVAAAAVKAARTQLHPLLNPTKGAGA